MNRIYNEKQTPGYLNEPARDALREGFDNYHDLNLGARQILRTGNIVQILPWLGDQVTNTITALLRVHGLAADCFAGIIDIRNSTIADFHQTAKRLNSEPKISAPELASHIPDTIIEKHDSLLPKEIRNIGYGAMAFDLDGAYKWLGKVSATVDKNSLL